MDVLSMRFAGLMNARESRQEAAPHLGLHLGPIPAAGMGAGRLLIGSRGPPVVFFLRPGPGSPLLPVSAFGSFAVCAQRSPT